MITKQQMIDLCLVRSNKEWGTIDGQILLAIATFLKEIDQEPVAKHKQEIMQEFTDVDEDRIGQLIKRKVELIERKTVLRLSVTESHYSRESNLNNLNDELRRIDAMLFRLRIRQKYSYEQRILSIEKKVKDCFNPVEQAEMIDVADRLRGKLAIINKELDEL